MTNKRQREQEQQFCKHQRQFEFELARAIAEESLTGERRRKALENIAEVEKQEAKQDEKKSRISAQFSASSSFPWMK